MHVVGYTNRFLKRTKKLLSHEQRKSLSGVFTAVSKNPWIGDALGPVWFREVRLRDKRIYFLVGETAVLFIDASDKDEQQTVIDECRSILDTYKEELRKLSEPSGRDQP